MTAIFFELSGKYSTYTQKTFNGEFKCEKPLRALCDLLYLRNDEYTRIDELEAQFRMKRQNMEEDLTSEDFDELQGKFNIPLIENFLSGIRKELRV